MSVQTIKGSVVFICDDCDDHLETNTDDFTASNRVRREAGWSARPVSGSVWEHNCVGCKGGYRKPDFRSQKRRL